MTLHVQEPPFRNPKLLPLSPQRSKWLISPPVSPSYVNSAQPAAWWAPGPCSDMSRACMWHGMCSPGCVVCVVVLCCVSGRRTTAWWALDGGAGRWIKGKLRQAALSGGSRGGS